MGLTWRCSFSFQLLHTEHSEGPGLMRPTEQHHLQKSQMKP